MVCDVFRCEMYLQGLAGIRGPEPRGLRDLQSDTDLGLTTTALAEEHGLVAVLGAVQHHAGSVHVGSQINNSTRGANGAAHGAGLCIVMIVIIHRSHLHKYVLLFCVVFLDYIIKKISVFSNYQKVGDFVDPQIGG